MCTFVLYIRCLDRELSDRPWRSISSLCRCWTVLAPSLHAGNAGITSLMESYGKPAFWAMANIERPRILSFFQGRATWETLKQETAISYCKTLRSSFDMWGGESTKEPEQCRAKICFFLSLQISGNPKLVIHHEKESIEAIWSVTLGALRQECKGLALHHEETHWHLLQDAEVWLGVAWWQGEAGS